MFTDRLRLSLSLVSGATTVTFASGSFEHLALSMAPHGFDADVTVNVSTEQELDPLLDAFSGPGLIEATLSLATCVLDGTGEEPEPVRITGYVIERSMREQASDEAAGEPIVGRAYRMRFMDPAAALWRQHRPIELFVGASVREVIEQHKAPGVRIEYDWPLLDEKLEVLCLAAGAEGGASFYDWVVWYVDHNGGAFEFDPGSGGYRIAGEKARPSLPVPIEREAIGELALEVPSPSRNAAQVLNADAAAPARVAVDNEQAVAGVRRDVLERAPLSQVIDSRRDLEARRLLAAAHGLRAVFRRCPPKLHAPGAFGALSAGWSGQLHGAHKAYRAVELLLEARAAAQDEGAEAGLDDPTAPFDMTLSTRFELASSPRRHLPPFARPHYPVIVEGRVVGGGNGEDRTWMLVEQEQTSQVRCKLNIPLWNKEVVATFLPGHSPGQLFFPAYHGQRVLVALGFTAAAIVRFLDWAANARAPADSQGNRIVLGYQAANGTVIEHAYQDGKPRLTIARVFGNDRQTIELSDGTLRLEVKEDASAQPITPSYDVTIVVQTSKERVEGAVEGAVAEVNESFRHSLGGVTASLDSAVAGLDASLAAAESSLLAKIAQVDAELQAMAAGAAATQALSAAVAEAKAALAAALA